VGGVKWWKAGLITVLAAGLWCGAFVLAEPVDQEVAAELDSRRLLGKAYYENDDFKSAAKEFRRCIELAPASAADHFNLGLVLLRASDYEESLRLLGKTQELDPSLVAPYFVRGIVLKRQGRLEEAIKDLAQVVERDPNCFGAYYNLGVCHKYLQQYEQAMAAMKAAVGVSPDHPSAHYQIITLARRLGRTEQARRHQELFDQVRDAISESEKTVEALERSKYSYIIEAPRQTMGSRPDAGAKVRFVEVTAQWGLPKPGTHHPAAAQVLSSSRPAPGIAEPAALRGYFGPMWGNGVSLADYDGDGDLDIYVVNCSTKASEFANRLYQNRGDGKFSDVSVAAGVAEGGMGFEAVFGDYDNDGHIDIYVVNLGPNVLYHNKGDGTFEDVSSAARVNEPQFGRSAVFMDYDHDNDLDIFVGNCLDFPPPSKEKVPGSQPFEGLSGQPNTLLRNNGDGTFSDMTDEAGLLDALEQTQEVLFADFDGDHDTDLLVVNNAAPSKLFLNARLGRFAVGGEFSPPIPADARTAVEGDFNGDGHCDLAVACGKQLFLYANDGRAGFTGSLIALPGQGDIRKVGVIDYNNDGWSDLLVAGEGSLRLLAGTGGNEFRDVSAAVGLGEKIGDLSASFIADLAVGDVDGDGDADIVLHTLDNGLVVLRNDGGNRGHWLNVRLVGKKVNRGGLGATVEIAGGGHYQKQTVRSGRVRFGLGDLETLDVVRVTWPGGVVQNVIRPAIDSDLTIEEHVRVSASCGFLYAYNGRGFELINEILGVGPLGAPMAPGVYHQPDCTEQTKIESGQLEARDGVYELRLTEELREIMYADRFALRVVDHPTELEIVANEMFTAPPFPEDTFFAVADHRVPVSAVDDRGADVLDLVRERDGACPTFPLTPYYGLARPHSITLDLGVLAGTERILLCLDGWIYWPEASTVMAIAQDGRFALTPLSLEVRDRRGRWQTAIESVGLPTSKGLVVPVDLTGRFAGDDYRVRLATTMCVYFDRIFVATKDRASHCRVTELPVASADLHYRGFSRMTRDALGYERFDYADVRPTGPWDPPQGMFTRYGDVTALLGGVDDRFVIFGPGDEVTLRFDARQLPGMPTGWTRDFIFYANGWVKDGDLNTAFSQSVEPLPFHGMSGYPYATTEHYPRSPELDRYRQSYNTRAGRSTVGRLAPVRRWGRFLREDAL
jgi:Tfp pilus assembly protein PilF